jgi:hypothetical protein
MLGLIVGLTLAWELAFNHDFSAGSLAFALLFSGLALLGVVRRFRPTLEGVRTRRRARESP